MLKLITLFIFIFTTVYSYAYELKPHHFIDQKYHGSLTKKNIEFKEGSFFSYFGYIPVNLYRENLYVVFHGEYSQAERFIKNTSIHKNLIKKGLFFAPNSFGDDWFHTKTYLHNLEILSEFLPEYINKYGIRNVYFIGYSSGGEFAYNLACKMNFNIKGIALINASITKKCNTNIKGIKVLNVIGEKDDFYSYEELKLRNTDYKMPSKDSLLLKDSENLLLTKLECQNPSLFPLADKNTSDDSKIIKKSYSCSISGKNKLETLFIYNMGHTWPNNKELNFSDFRGNTNKDINLGDYIVNFFN